MIKGGFCLDHYMFFFLKLNFVCNLPQNFPQLNGSSAQINKNIIIVQ